MHVLSDIIDDKLAEEALHQQEQFFRSTIDGLSAHICVIDAKGRIIVTNHAWEKFGLENNSAGGAFGAGCNYFDACRSTSEDQKVDIEESAAGIRAVIAGTMPEFVKEYPCHSPGQERWFICRVNQFSLSGENYAVISHENITARKKMEEALRASEAHYRLLTEDVSDVVWKLDRDYRYLYISPAAERMRGFRPDELIGRTVFEHLTEEGATAFRKIILQRQESEGNGAQIDSITFEVAQRCRDGKAIWLEIYFSHERDALGTITGYHGISRDITERKQANQSRLAAMAEMISAIAHQWRQPLATLGMIIQRAHAEGTMNRLTPICLNEFKANAMRQIRHMSDTIEEFRSFYRPDKQKEPFSPLSCVNDAVGLLQSQFSGSGIAVDIHCLGCDGQLVKGIPSEFKQVILNLLGNARDAILESRGTNGALEDGRIGVQISVNAGSAMTIDISDSGCGIPAEIAPRIFAQYFTTKEKSGGTGIGLYMSRMIVEESLGGSLSLKQGQEGATFSIELPLENSP